MKTIDETRNFILEYLGRAKDYNATLKELGLDENVLVNNKEVK